MNVNNERLSSFTIDGAPIEHLTLYREDSARNVRLNFDAIAQN